VTGKQLASAEAATWLGEHFTSTLGDVKSAVDNYFLGGVNHICYHGTPFSPESETWPGFLFYAAVHFGPTNSFWRDFPTLNNYIARCQSFLQAGKPDNELLLYYPIYDSWAQPGRSLLQHYGGGHETPMSQLESKMLLDAGYSFDLISDRQIADLSFIENSLRSGDLTYQAIVLPSMKLIPLRTFDKLMALAKWGATIVVRGGLPVDVPGLRDSETQRLLFQRLTAEIKFTDAGAAKAQVAPIGKGRFILSDDLGQALSAAGIKRETLVDTGLKFVRRKHDRGHYYFIVNPGKEPFDSWIGLQGEAKSAAIFDPMVEEKGLAAFRSSPARGTEVYLQLAPGESRILKTFTTKIVDVPYVYYTTQGEPKKIDGKWSLRFISGGPATPLARELASLGSWTDLNGGELKNFSGTARYTVSFEKPAGNAQSWFLDLGRVAESASVRLNGRDLGTLIKAPYRLNLPSTLLKNRNTLEVDVSNLMANRIAHLDRGNIGWKKFYNTNFPSKLPENKGPDGLFSAARWNPFPSGLIGPVTLTPATIMKFDQK
jgi:hypothetical protein